MEDYMNITKMKGFDSDKFLKVQKEKIMSRMQEFGKLYIEFGGKIFDDLHAKRVLPGYRPDNKVRLLQTLSDDMEIILTISAKAIEKSKIRADLGLTYDLEVMRLMDELRRLKLNVSAVVITLYEHEPRADKFASILKARGERVYFHTYTKGYPTDIDTIVSEEGYGKNPYIETTKSLVVVAAPGPGSGKLATCLSQMYHEYKMGMRPGYAKFETFPVWNLPLNHPVNIAYESATADLKDVNMVDSYHLQAYNTVAVNYNRDLETFPILRAIINKIMGRDVYKSPTDMGINMIKPCIVDDNICQEAGRQEIIRRYFRALVDQKKGLCSMDTVLQNEKIMANTGLNPLMRRCVLAANNRKNETNTHCIALELDDDTIIVGRAKGIMTAGSAVVLNALKYLARIDDDVQLISYEKLRPIIDFKSKYLGTSDRVLHLNDILVIMCIYAPQDELIKRALDHLHELADCEGHSSHILSKVDEDTFRKLQINITAEPKFQGNNLFEN